MAQPRRSRTAVVKLLLGAAFIALLVGGAATVVGVTGRVSNPDAVPTCDGETMSAGDRCDVLRGGSTVDSYTYDEKIDRQHRNKDRAGDTITIGLTVMSVSLLAGLLVEIVFPRFGRRTRSAAGAPTSPPPAAAPPENIPPFATPQASGTASRRGPLRVVIASAAGMLCAVLAVLVTVVVTNRGDSSRTSSPANASPPASATPTMNGPDVEELRRAMPEVLRAATLCRSHNPDPYQSVIRSGTCNLLKDSPFISGLVVEPRLAAIFEAAIVAPASYREKMRRSSSVPAFRDDGSVYAVFIPYYPNADPPGLGNSLQYLDLRTGLFIKVNHFHNQQDAATFLQRAGF